MKRNITVVWEAMDLLQPVMIFLHHILHQNIPKALIQRYLMILYIPVNLKLTDPIEGLNTDAGKLVLSPTRTYAPVIKKILETMRPEIHGMVHCSGGGQTKVMHFIDNMHIVKDNCFLAAIVQDNSGTIGNSMGRNVQSIQYGSQV